MSTPKCLHCLTSLKRVQQSTGYFYRCTQCQSGFSSYKYLSTHLKDYEYLKIISEADKNSIVSARSCPVCTKKMNLALNVKGDCDLDLCNRCKIVWFDFHESAELEKIDHEPKENKLKFPSHFKNDPFLFSQDYSLSHDLRLMFLPRLEEEESDRFKIDTWGTWLLSILCVFISIYCFKDLNFYVSKYGFLKDLNLSQFLLRDITSFFIHGSWFHLIYNIYFLWIFGDNVENELGTSKFLFLVLLGTTLGHLFFKFFSPEAQLVSIGASGGIFSVMVYYLFKFPHRRFTYYLRGYPIRVSCGVFFFFFLLLPTVFGLYMQSIGATTTSHLSHLGGAFAGLIMYFATSKK